jgi:hypothetical protein
MNIDTSFSELQYHLKTCTIENIMQTQVVKRGHRQNPIEMYIYKGMKNGAQMINVRVQPPPI